MPLALYIILKIVIALLIIVAALFVICAVAFHIILVSPPVFKESKPNKLMGKNFPAMAKRTLDDVEILKTVPQQKVTVKSHDGIDLGCYLFKNSKPTDTTIICIHGYNSTGYNDYSTKALAFLEAGYNVFVVNLRHADGNGGKYIGFGALEKYDIIKYVEYINSIYPDGKIFLHGTSMGGATVMQASCFDLTPNVKGIIDDCGFTTVKAEVKFMLNSSYLPAFPISNILELYFKAFAKYDFTSSDSRTAVAETKLPMLFIHGTDDAFVPLFMGQECFDACKSEKEMLTVPGAGHAAAYFTEPERYMKVMNSFIAKYSTQYAEK